MDRDDATAALVANTVDLASWCEQQAQLLDSLHGATNGRPLSPQECRDMVDIQRETLRRVGQAHVLWLTLLPGVVVYRRQRGDGRWAVERVPPWRRWLRRIVG